MDDVLRWRRRKSKCSRQLRKSRQVDTFETCNLMSTGSKLATFVDRSTGSKLATFVDRSTRSKLATFVDRSTRSKLDTLCRVVDTFQPYAGRQVDTLETETSQRGARSFDIYLLDSIVRQ